MPVLGDVTVAELAEFADRLVGLDPATLCDRETIAALHRFHERVGAVLTQAAGAFDAAGAWQRSGARSAASWLATTCNLSFGVAKHRVELGRELRTMPVVTNAWLAGELSEAHVARMVATRTFMTSRFFARDEAFLVEQATTFRFGQFTRVLRYWAQAADPDGAEGDATRIHDSRHLHLSSTLADRRILDGTLDPLGGAIFESELKRLEQQLYEQEVTEVKAAAGEGGVHELLRTPAQRRADALVEMAKRSAAIPEGARMPQPLFSVFVGYETFAGRICELANGAVVSPGSLVPYVSEAVIERIVFDGPSRVIDVGVRRRLFSRATRRAVEVRDRECYHRFCDIRAEDCEIDHIEPHGAGGDTVTANGRPACGFHNRLRQRREPPPVP